MKPIGKLNRVVLWLASVQLALALLLAALGAVLAVQFDLKYEFSQISGVGLNLFRITADRYILMSVLLLGFIILALKLEPSPLAQFLTTLPILILLHWCSILVLQDSLVFPYFQADYAMWITVLTSASICFLGLLAVLFTLNAICTFFKRRTNFFL